MKLFLKMCMIGSCVFNGFAFGVEMGKRFEESIYVIDEQIEKLEQLKMGYWAKILRHEDLAERLQFEEQTGLEARRHIEIAEQNRVEVAKIQFEIDQLQLRKLEMLRQNE